MGETYGAKRLHLLVIGRKQHPGSVGWRGVAQVWTSLARVLQIPIAHANEDSTRTSLLHRCTRAGSKWKIRDQDTAPSPT